MLKTHHLLHIIIKIVKLSKTYEPDVILDPGVSDLLVEDTEHQGGVDNEVHLQNSL